MTDRGREFLEPCKVCGKRQMDVISFAGFTCVICTPCINMGPYVDNTNKNPVGSAMVLWNRAAKGEI